MKYCAALITVLFIIIGCGEKPQLVNSASGQFNFAKNLYEKKKYYKAQIAFENLIYTYPGNTVIDTAQYYLSMSFYQQKDYGLAAGEFMRLLSAYPQSEFADDSQYQIAMCHYKMSPKYQLDQNETYLAIDEFRSLITNYPVSQLKTDAITAIKELEAKLAKKKFKTGELYMKLGDYEPALSYFSYVRDNYPATDWAIRAFYYTGETQVHLKKYEEALQTFDNFLIGFSDHELASKAKKKIEKINKKISNSES